VFNSLFYILAFFLRGLCSNALLMLLHMQLTTAEFFSLFLHKRPSGEGRIFIIFLICTSISPALEFI
jgi:hypothetical protein